MKDNENVKNNDNKENEENKEDMEKRKSIFLPPDYDAKKEEERLRKGALLRREADKFGFFLEEEEWKEYILYEDRYDIKKGYVVRTYYYDQLFWDECGGKVFFSSLEEADKFIFDYIESIVHMPREGEVISDW